MLDERIGAAQVRFGSIASFWLRTIDFRSTRITKSHGPSPGPLTQIKSLPLQAEATIYWLQSARSWLHGIKVTAFFDPLRIETRRALMKG